ncbi:CatB-related O-acetyltransferase [Halogeometricum limi]|nr:CatB-related O-acetyltransferase [Halogeometricum limi]
MSLHALASRLLAQTGYPDPVRRLLDFSPVETHIETEGPYDIAPGTEVLGSLHLGANVDIPRGCFLDGDIHIGRGSSLGVQNRVVGDVRIGRYVAVAPSVVFQEPNHEQAKMAIQGKFYRRVLDEPLAVDTDGPIRIGHDVWIGDGAKILSGVEVGHGAVVAAGAIVTKDVEPYAVVAGVPARRIEYRFDEAVRERLLELAWWEREEDELRRRREWFEGEIRSVEDLPDPDER